MQFITVRDLRSKPTHVWRQLSKEKEIVLTLNGKPIAIMFAVSADTLEESLIALRRAKAIIAVEHMQTESTKIGTDRLSLDEINKEIAATRKARKSK